MTNVPKSFIFGLAESDLQTVGSSYPQKKEKSQNTMWDVFSSVQKKDTPSFGSHKYMHTEEDTKLISNLGIRAYRTSISMSRTIDKNGKINKKAIEWYRNYFGQIKEKGIQIHACLYHWEAPDIFSKKGIIDKDFSDYYIKHVAFVLESLSDLVDYYIPINEAWCMSFLSYYRGIHAPGLRSTELYFRSYFRTIELQTLCVLLIKKYSSNNKIGLVNIHFPTYILSNSEDISYINIRNRTDNLTNYIYSDPFFWGSIDSEIIDTYKQYFPKDYNEILKQAKLAKEISYYGVNYYNSQYVKPAINDLGYDLDFPPIQLTNSLGWPVSIPPYYPDGLTDILVSYSQRYAGVGLKSLIVSENGTPCNTEFREREIPNDEFRIYYVQEHLKQIEKSIKKGAKVDGYFLWTLLDNYEWQEGYKPESAFGLIAVDRKTGNRTPKKSYYWYQQKLKEFYE